MNKLNFTPKTISEVALAGIGVLATIGYVVAVIMKVSVPTEFVTLSSTVIGGLLGYTYRPSTTTTTTTPSSSPSTSYSVTSTTPTGS